MNCLESLSQDKMLKNILRIISMLEKELERIARRNHHRRSQYPEIFFKIEAILHNARAWIKIHIAFRGVPVFSDMLVSLLNEISSLIGELIVECTPVKGKRGVKKARQIKERKRFEKSIDNMIKHIEEYLLKLKQNGTEIEASVEEALIKAFERDFLFNDEKEFRFCVSGRGGKTIIFPWSDKASYFFLVENKKRFRSEVVERLKKYPHACFHKPACKCTGKYRMRGFRSNNRKVVMKGGKQEEFRIRMLECAECGQRFSLLPGFLPREKHFEIDIIGNIVKGIVLFGNSLQSAINNSNLTGRKLKSKQTILNWLRWFGTLHPASILTRAGVKGSGYFQEDEGFEKESGMRTYTVAMADPENLLVWHLDYVDFVDAETLTESFESFVEKIDFKVIGVTKDKWQPSTDALNHAKA